MSITWGSVFSDRLFYIDTAVFGAFAIAHVLARIGTSATGNRTPRGVSELGSACIQAVGIRGAATENWARLDQTIPD
jgi:hypothetical protein